MICKVSQLQVLDLSNNELTGHIPQCLGNFIHSLSVLAMRNNHFQGSLPKTFINGCSLTTLDLNHNQIQGKIPHSLVPNKMLEVLNLGKTNWMIHFFSGWSLCLSYRFLSCERMHSMVLYGILIPSLAYPSCMSSTSLTIISFASYHQNTSKPGMQW